MWNDLSMREKAAMMKVAVNNGIYNLEEIKNKFDDGGYMLPETNATPFGNYTTYNGEEIIPVSRKEFINLKREGARLSAANRMLHIERPIVPYIPSLSWKSRLAGWNGATDEERIAKYGLEAGSSCIYTATGLYDDENCMVPGNKTFYDDPNKYGFTEVKKGAPGDMIVFIGNGLRPHPHHAATITGYDTKLLKPMVSYSNGGGTPEDMVRNNNNWGFEKKDGFWPLGPLGKYKTYRYTGTDDKLSEWNKEYNQKYKNK